MFWKRILKTAEEPKKGFSVPEDIRKSFRVSPSAEAPIRITLDQKTVSVIDISSGGACFKNNNLKSGVFYPSKFLLPDEVDEISVNIEILKIDENNLCRSRFHDLNPEQEEMIHQYVLNRQKEILAEQKKRLTF